MRQSDSLIGSAAASELLERGRELSMLGDCLEAVQASSQGSVVAIGGEAGVGKTALVPDGTSRSRT